MKLRVLELCQKKGITQKALAVVIGVTPEALSTSINGNPRKSTLEKIATALGVDITDLFEQPKKEYFHCPECGARIELFAKQEIMKELAKSII